MNEQTKEWSRKILNVASEKIDAELDRMGNKIPYISYNGKYTDVIKDRGIDWWTNGFGVVFYGSSFTRQNEKSSKRQQYNKNNY